jgi:eukaryotic-like serine/threonine-protein kinase
MSAVAHKTQLGKYRLIAELGYGGMADVHLAVATGHAGTQKLVVIKQLRQRMLQEDEFLNMFLDEGRLAVRLNHPNVVQTFEVGVEEGKHFIVMEYLDGLALNVILRAMRPQGGLPLGMQLRVLTDMLAGLHYAHNVEDFDGTPLKIVHRDVTPHNTFVTYDGQTKVVDFGIAKALRSSTQTTTGVIKGKISYMSPEQSRSEAIDRRSDVYAAGIMLWEAVTGTRFWKGLADMTILQRLMTNQPAPSPREVKPELSDLVVEVCGRALSARAEDRYATAAELQTGVEAILVELGQQQVTSRDVGKYVREFFSETRQKTKALIETQMRIPAEEAAALPELRHQSFWPQSSLTPSGDSSSGTTPSGGHSSAVRPEQASGESAQVQAPSEGPSRSRLRTFGLLFGASLLLGAGVTAFVRSKHDVATGGPLAGSSSALAAGGVAAPPGAAPGGVAADQVAVRFSAQPPEAKLFFDDQPLKSNPYEGKLPRDGGAHSLRAEAVGFQSKAQTISLSADAAHELELVRAPKAADVRPGRYGRGAKPTASGAVAAPSSAEASPAGTNSIVLPKQTPGSRSIVIDVSDPWKQKEKAQ